MMTNCPECGSTEIVPDLVVFANDAASGSNPPYVKLLEPEPAKHGFIWVPKDVVSGFHAAICGACGHTQFYTKRYAQFLEAHKQGYKSETYSMNTIPFS